MITNDVYLIIHHILDLYQNFVQGNLLQDQLMLVQYVNSLKRMGVEELETVSHPHSYPPPYNNLDVIEYLLNNNADIDCEDNKDGHLYIPLHIWINIMLLIILLKEMRKIMRDKDQLMFVIEKRLNS